MLHVPSECPQYILLSRQPDAAKPQKRCKPGGNVDPAILIAWVQCKDDLEDDNIRCLHAQFTTFHA